MTLEQRLKPKSILVIGDIMLDTYITGDVRRISPEAPVPVFKRLSESHAPGGAGNVAANLCAAGQRVSVIGVVGSDASGDILLGELNRLPADTGMVLRSKSRPTTVKTRLVTRSRHQVLRQDAEDDSPLPDSDAASLKDAFMSHFRKFDVIAVSDYMKGLLTLGLMREIIEAAGKAGFPVIVDVKDADYKKYAGAFLLKPNLAELQALTGIKIARIR
jgi:D-beta-D-heptose 7-phosphate kinase/D-beta-D-heptose 1-phosphate adenosyltransferase